MGSGRLTLPVQEGIDEAIIALIRRLGADAVRNSDGTELPAMVHDLATKVYGTYFVGRGDQAWALSHPEQSTHVYLMSARTPAHTSAPLTIIPADGYLADQVEPDTTDAQRWWQVNDRTTGQTLRPTDWQVTGQGAQAKVTIPQANPGHVYTVNFLARQIWDPTQMYNYLMNDWHTDPTRVRERPYDIRYPETWAHIRTALAEWLEAHTEVDVVRFTTFFYHFTLVYDDQQRERFVDWFGYSASVSIPALEAFEAQYGYQITAEDFVDEGYYNSSFRIPSRPFRDWIAFTHEYVTARVRELTDQVHASGKEAMMFLGDNWIGTEPYGPHFPRTNLDAVVGSVGSAATCRMIADIPSVRYTEGRFLPYFFPDVFSPGGDPVGEAEQSWLTARRAIVRSPLDRIGYGGYPALALQFPAFLDRIESIAEEFRELHDRTGGERPSQAKIEVGILNAWGALRSWGTHMVAHALPYRQAYSYLGVLESLAGLPFKVHFLSFDDIADGVPDSITVLVNAGAAGTAFSGGSWWADPRISSAVRCFVSAGGGLIGVGDPSAHPANGVYFQLAEVLGVDREIGWGLSTRRYPRHDPNHFIVADLDRAFDPGESTPGIVPVSDLTQVLRFDSGGDITLATNTYGAGRAVYASGLPWSPDNNRLLHRAIHWAANDEAGFSQWIASDPRVEIAHWPTGAVLAYNMASEVVTTTIHTPDRQWSLTLPPGGSSWQIP